jgi:exodeoxyribonuclease V alpha subunit
MVLGVAGDLRPMILDEGQIYIHRQWHAEVRFARLLRQLAQNKATAAKKRAAARHLPAVSSLGGAGRALTAEQAAAALAAVTSGVTVVSGGPGTGKTTIVIAILRLLRRLGVQPGEILMATPTGRAAYRMQEAMREGLAALASHDPLDDLSGVEAPQTLHRLLAATMDGRTFRHHEGSRLSCRWLIVDECSMAELGLMARLLGALPEGASLVLLGDADQLPSVNEGAVFRDTVAADPAKVGPGFTLARLTENHRASTANPKGRNITLVAAKIREGDAAGLFTAKPGVAGGDEVILPLDAKEALPLAKVRLIDPGGSPRVLKSFLASWHAQLLAPWAKDGRRLFAMVGGQLAAADIKILEALFQAQGAARLVCPSKHGRTGVEAVNEALHGMVAGSSKRALEPWLPGEPIMMTSNNYRLDIYNGDVGLVIRIALDGGEERLVAAFKRAQGIVTCSLEELREDIVHAYATTVHKAQGGEHAHVGLILPDEDQPLTTRELIYTAVTRARESVTIVGSGEVLKAGIARKTARHSRLSARLGV